MIEMALAQIHSASEPDPRNWDKNCWRIDVYEGVWRVGAIGWAALDRGQRVDRLREIVARAAADNGAMQLDWLASGVSLDRRAIVTCAARWREAGIVPLLDVVALDPSVRDADGRHGVVTKGLSIVTGYEVEAVWAIGILEEQSILIAQLAARLFDIDLGATSEVKDQTGRLRVFERRDRGYFTNNAVISFALPPGIDTDQ